MATADRETSAAPADEVATVLQAADLVRLTSAASGDSLAATGTLGRALSAIGTPFQASVVPPGADTARATDADVTVAIGRDDSSAAVTLVGPDSASATAFEVATELGAAPDPSLALAGTIAAGSLDERIAEAGEDAGLTRRSGVAVPTAALADGLAHSTLFHAPFSGDVEAAGEVLAELSIPADASVDDLNDDDRARLASLVALAAGDGAGSDRAADAIERALRPYVGGPVGTIGGFADVLDATARASPGVGVSLALGDTSVTERALERWRTHAGHAHESIRTCDTARHDGLVVARGESMPVATVARLLADFRAREPVVLAVADGEAAVYASGVGAETDVASALATAVATADGDATGTGSRARARFDGDADDLIAAFREAR